MSSQSIVTQNRKFLLNSIGNQLPKKLQGLFCFGVRAFSLQPLVSCNSNARMSHLGNRVAAEQQMYRLLHHPKLFLLVWRAIAKQLALTSRSLVNVDYSNLGSLAILGFGLQTKHGRALPVLMRSLASNTQGQKKTHPKYHKLKKSYLQWKKQVQADQFSFVIKSLRLLAYIYNCQPRLVFDRGFVHKGIVQFLCRRQWLFYLRMRSDYYVEYAGQYQLINQLKPGEYKIYWEGELLRLIVGKPKKRTKEPWYILTNDNNTAVKKIWSYYYHRFEIEESFRDLKSLLKLKGSRVRTWESLRVILCFMSLALICALRETMINKLTQTTVQKTQGAPPSTTKPIVHSKKTLSLVRIWQETIQRALRHSVLTDWSL
jgi:hypothetical protein